MKIVSAVFENQKTIPDKYTCKGDGVNPPLEFVDVPPSTKSLTLIVDDPDAPGGSPRGEAGDFVHWVTYNIPVTISALAEGTKPAGVEGFNSGGRSGYYPPCPPTGTHRYFFKLYALDAELKLSGKADKKAVEAAMQGHIIEQAELIGLYSK